MYSHCVCIKVKSPTRSSVNGRTNRPRTGEARLENLIERLHFHLTALGELCRQNESIFFNHLNNQVRLMSCTLNRFMPGGIVPSLMSQQPEVFTK